MTTEKKAELVASVWEAYGLASALAAVELPKTTWYYQQQKVGYEEKYAHLQPFLERIIREHPAYGVLRVTTELRETYGQHVNHKVVQRLLKLGHLSLLRSVRPPKPSCVRQAIVAAGQRANRVAQMGQTGLFAVAYTDFTELLYANGRRKAYLMPIIGHRCKMAYGWAVGPRANTTLAMTAWERARQTFQEQAIPYQGMVIHHDQDSVYTGYRWMEQLLLKDKVYLSYALNGARDNPEMESFIGRFKVENESLLLEAVDLVELRAVVDRQMRYYNECRRHSSIGYVSPLAYLQKVWSNDSTSD